jgi:hypothetical protein
MQKIFRILLVATALIIAALWFVHWSRTRALNSGEVYVREQGPDNSTTPPPSGSVASQPAPPQELADSGAGSSSAASSNDGVASLPSSQPLSRTPQNGIVTAGSGKYELFRQGDITYRLNTQNGQSCVLFATTAQWSKTLVYEHGCNSH